MSKPEQIFHEFFSVFQKMPKPLRKEWFLKTRFQGLPQKYLFGISRFSQVSCWHALGLIPADEAEIINENSYRLFMKNIQTKLQACSFEALSRNQQHIYMIAMDEIQDETYRFDVEDLRSFLTWGKEVYPNLKDVLTFMAQTDFDKYAPVLTRFNKKYFEPVTHFERLCKVIADESTRAPGLDLSDVLKYNSCVFKGNSMETAIARLELTGAILATVEQKYPLFEQMTKAKGYWHLLKDYYFNLSLRYLNRMPANELHLEMKNNVKQMTDVFKGFFPSSIDAKTAEILMGYLLVNVRSCLTKTTDKIADKLLRSLYFDKSVGLTIGLEAKIENYPELNQDFSTLGLLSRALGLDNKLVFENQKTPEELIKEAQEMFAQSKRGETLNGTSFYEEALVHLSYLKRIYYNEEDQRIDEAKYGVFGKMKDHELLYLMGVLSLPDYQACCHMCETLQYDEDQAVIREVNIKDLFVALMDKTPSLILPLKKEHINVMDQLRLAGSLYDRLYLDDCVQTRIRVHHKNPFSNVCDFQSNLLRGEGLFLEDMILLMHGVSPRPVQTSLLTKRLVDSYWRESVEQLKDLSLHTEDKMMAKRLSDNQSFFELNLKTTPSLAQRVPSYQLLFSDIRHHLFEEYDVKWKMRAEAFNNFSNYVKQFTDTWQAQTRVKTNVRKSASCKDRHENS